MIGGEQQPRTARLDGAQEALPHTPPGGNRPSEAPAPFPSAFIFQNGGNLSRVRKPRKKRAPLTDSLRSEDLPVGEGKGASGQGAYTASRWSAPRIHVMN